MHIDVSATNSSDIGSIFARNAALSAGALLALNRYGGGVAVQQTTVASDFALELSGAVRCTALTQTSGGNLKTVLGSSLSPDFILKLGPVSYRCDPTLAPVDTVGDADGNIVEITIPSETPKREHQGLIAQEVAALRRDRR